MRLAAELRDVQEQRDEERARADGLTEERNELRAKLEGALMGAAEARGAVEGLTAAVAEKSEVVERLTSELDKVRRAHRFAPWPCAVAWCHGNAKRGEQHHLNCNPHLWPSMSPRATLPSHP